MNAFSTTGRRSAAVLILSGMALVATIATAAAFNGRGDGAAAPTPSAPVLPAPDPTGTPVLTPAPEPSSTPDVETPAPAPTETPAPAPTETPDEPGTPAPTDGGGDAMPITVDLENVTGNDVYVDIVDYGGSLVDARSGTPGDGMSVEPYTLEVENVDDRTLRLTWVDFAMDNALALYIYGDVERFVLVQPEPGEAVDAMGFDRELILTFDRAVSADAIETFLQGGLDTPGVE